MKESQMIELKEYIYTAKQANDVSIYSVGLMIVFIMLIEHMSEIILNLGLLISLIIVGIFIVVGSLMVDFIDKLNNRLEKKLKDGKEMIEKTNTKTTNPKKVE